MFLFCFHLLILRHLLNNYLFLLICLHLLEWNHLVHTLLLCRLLHLKFEINLSILVICYFILLNSILFIYLPVGRYLGCFLF